MLVSLARRAVFAHIPKTGGASIAEVLRRSGFVDYGNPHVNGLSDFPNFFKTCMVRNPYEIVASYYVHKTESGYSNSFKNFVDELVRMRSGEKIITQYEYALKCNYVMNYDDYNNDFRILCDLLKIPYQKPPLIHKFKDYDWRTLYSKETAGKVYEKTHTDFKVLKYDSGSWEKK